MGKIEARPSKEKTKSVDEKGKKIMMNEIDDFDGLDDLGFGIGHWDDGEQDSNLDGADESDEPNDILDNPYEGDNELTDYNSNNSLHVSLDDGEQDSNSERADPKPQFGGFLSAGGQKISISKEALAHVKNIFNDETKVVRDKCFHLR